MECLLENREERILWGEELEQFTLSQYICESRFSIGLNIHGNHYGQEREDPWGNIFRARIDIVRGGMLEISEE